MLLLILRYLRKDFLRTVLTGGAVALVVLIFGTIYAILQSFNAIVGSAGIQRSLLVKEKHKAIWQGELPLSYGEVLKKMPGVTAVTPMTIEYGYLKGYNMREITLIAIDPAVFFRINPEETRGISPQEIQEFQKDPRTALVSGNLVKEGVRMGQDLTIEKSRIPRKSFQVRVAGSIKKGVYSYNMVLLTQEYFGKLENTGRVNDFQIGTQPSTDIKDLARKIDRFFSAKATRTDTVPLSSFFAAYLLFVDSVKAFLLLIFTFGMITIVMIVVNSLSIAVIQRYSHLGILKSLGFKNAQILSLIVGESLVLCGTAGLFSSATVFLVPRFFVFYWGSDPLFSSAATPVTLLLSFLLSLAIGLGGGIVPAYLASRLPVIQLLRRV